MNAKNLFTTLALNFGKGLKAAALQMIVAAETTLPGSTGAEKRAYVVQRLDDMLPLPWYLEALDGPAIGVLVDVICSKLNLLTDHDKISVAKVDPEKLAVVIDATDAELAQEKTVDEKLEALYTKYNV